MKRRQVIQSLGLLSTHAMFPTVLSGFIASCAGKDSAPTAYDFFTGDEANTILDVIDLIIPATTTKSASEVNTHLFLDQVFAKCMDVQQQDLMRQGLAELTAGLKDSSSRIDYLTGLDKKAFANDDASAYFKSIKQYTLIGFFTSQEGTTKASNYLKVPEEYKGEIPATERTLNYGKTSLTYGL